LIKTIYSWVLSLLTLVLWGLWGVLIKLATATLSWKEYLIFSTLPWILGILAMALFFRAEISLDLQRIGVFWSLLSGTASLLAMIPFFFVLETGKASIVIPLIALYPIVTILIEILILKETLTITQGVGILLALLAIVLMSK
jgi:transporter family protein